LAFPSVVAKAQRNRSLLLYSFTLSVEKPVCSCCAHLDNSKFGTMSRRTAFSLFSIALTGGAVVALLNVGASGDCPAGGKPLTLEFSESLDNVSAERRRKPTPKKDPCLQFVPILM